MQKERKEFYIFSSGSTQEYVSWRRNQWGTKSSSES